MYHVTWGLYDRYNGDLPHITPIVGDPVFYFVNNLQVSEETASARFAAGDDVEYIHLPPDGHSLTEKILMTALMEITRIKNETTGGDWDEIDEAREIALNTLAIIDHMT